MDEPKMKVLVGIQSAMEAMVIQGRILYPTLNQIFYF